MRDYGNVPLNGAVGTTSLEQSLLAVRRGRLPLSEDPDEWDRLAAEAIRANGWPLTSSWVEDDHLTRSAQVRRGNILQILNEEKITP